MRKRHLLYGILLLAFTLLFFPCTPVSAAGYTGPAEDDGIFAAPSAQSARTFSKTAAASDVYRRLKNGKPVRIAILGDSIADKTGVANPAQSWDSLLLDWLTDEYASSITLDNYAIGGTTSYTGYYQAETAMRAAVRAAGSYDLVIICYGQNDAPENFCLYYEAMLRSVKKQNRSCQLITILESSQQVYTEKMQEIIRLSGLYGADVADTISAFFASGFSYEALTPDGTHPNETGHQIYFEAVRNIIEANVAEGKKAAALPAASSPYMTLFENYSFIPLDKLRTADGQYILTTKTPSLGIVFKKCPGGSDIRLDFSTGEAWADTGDTSILKEWTTAAPIGLLIAPGTTITLTSESGNIEDTVIGFISSGYLPAE